MKKEIEFLNFVYKNAQMGVDSINQLVDIAQNENFKKMLKSQLTDYENVSRKSEKMIRELNENDPDENFVQKIQTYLMVGAKTLLDKSADNIAGMLMQGSVMGIIQIIRRIKQYEGQIDENIINLGKKLLEIEERNLNECKKFLG